MKNRHFSASLWKFSIEVWQENNGIVLIPFIYLKYSFFDSVSFNMGFLFWQFHLGYCGFDSHPEIAIYHHWNKEV